MPSIQSLPSDDLACIGARFARGDLSPEETFRMANHLVSFEGYDEVVPMACLAAAGETRAFLELLKTLENKDNIDNYISPCCSAIEVGLLEAGVRGHVRTVYGILKKATSAVTPGCVETCLLNSFLRGQYAVVEVLFKTGVATPEDLDGLGIEVDDFPPEVRQPGGLLRFADVMEGCCCNYDRQEPSDCSCMISSITDQMDTDPALPLITAVMHGLPDKVRALAREQGARDEDQCLLFHAAAWDNVPAKRTLEVMLALVDHAGSNLSAQVHRAVENASAKFRNAVIRGLDFMASGDSCGLASYCAPLPNGFTEGDIATTENRRANEAEALKDDIDEVSSLKSYDSSTDFGSDSEQEVDDE